MGRIRAYSAESFGEKTQKTRSWLGCEQIGGFCEGFDRFAMVAVSVPPAVDQAAIQEIFSFRRQEAGDVYVEEAILRE